MATFDEIAKGYSDQIRAVAKSDRSKIASVLNESVKRDRVANEFKKIHKDLDKYTINDRRLTEEERGDIIGRAGRSLGLRNPDKLYRMIKEASNDDFVELASYWDDFFSEIDE